MSKLLPAVLVTLLFTGMTFFAFYQSGTITTQEFTIDEQGKEIVYLEASLKDEESINEDLRNENTVLKETVRILRDSIYLLESEISKLQRTVKQQKKTIKSIKAQLKDLQSRYDAIQRNIAAMSSDDVMDKDQIAQLEADKKYLLQQINDLTIIKDQEVASRQETEAELLDRQVSEARFKRITSLVNDTKVQFKSITLSKKRFGKPISKIKKENSKWKYTIVEFYLQHEDLNLLLDEKFLVKIVNSGTGEVLSYIESNPNFPDSQIDSKGVEFRYDGNLVEVSYYNNQEKMGDDYEIQIFYISEGEEYLLLNGAKPFLQNRKVLKP